jgi:alkylation response protein AidB-like acyl-CoA dehydrogenase
VPAGAAAGLVVAHDGEELVAIEGPPGDRVDDLGFLALADRDLTGPGIVRHVLVTGPAAVEAHRTAVLQWRLGTAAALAGAGHQAVRIGVDYACERQQFGVPIGSFQAVQHGFADVALRVEGSELIALKAAWAADTGADDWGLLAAMAFAHAAEAAQDAATAALHYHGGYGVALEYDIHRYVRRAKGWTLAAGDVEEAWQSIGREHVALAGRR